MKLVYYTCSTGPDDGFVPSIKEQLPDNVEAFYVHDGHIKEEANKGWSYLNLLDYPDVPDHVQHRQRYAKTLHHVLFPDADWTLYVDQKHHFHRSFFETVETFIEDTREFIVSSHPENRSFVEEFMFAFNRGTFSYEYAMQVLNKMATLKIDPDKFVSLRADLLLRKNCESVNSACQRWYDLIRYVYSGDIRDQLLLPYCGPSISTIDDMDYVYAQTSHFQPAYNARVRPQVDAEKALELEVEITRILS